MPDMQYLDLKASVSWSGDFHFQIPPNGTDLDEHLTKEQVLALLYPILKDKANELAALRAENPMPPAAQPDDAPSPPAAPATDPTESGS